MWDRVAPDKQGVPNLVSHININRGKHYGGVIVGAIYKIENLVNSKVYVGSTIDFPKRKREHLNSLRKGKHHSIHLQRAWNAYGEKNFTISILEKIADDELRNKELEWINKLDSLNRDYGYNVSESTTNFSASGENHPLFGKNRSELGHINYWKGKTIPEHIKVKMRKPKSEEGKRNMSINHADFSGSKNPMAKKVIQLTLDGEFVKVWDTCTIAMNEFRNKFSSSIKACCQGRSKTAYGYKWYYLDEYEQLKASN